ncbi:MAG: calycin-like domain-containing protein [Bacteroides pyogenes]|uniref:calycin-like domain-containing protein n=1 Tax=Bacteroides pyogenes TaxID=310300 RepID=UPI00242FED08|nr:calycin-like domain-containing protein [Bacteroides pyogenes]MCI7070664.1 calycin-like domain-containing protein [Bacteroides pyogenes]MDY5354025.1 calycin-like domain-containing protein [Bacteroides pyogenes]
MKILTNWKVSIMMLTLLSAAVGCSSNDDPVDDSQAKAMAGTYKGYSVGESKMFSDYLMGASATAEITANPNGTINLNYKSGAGDFVLNGLEIKSGKFKGEGEVTMSMGGGPGKKYPYAIEGGKEGKALSMKATIPSVMGGLTISFVEGEAPVNYHAAGTYQHNTELRIKIGGAAFDKSTDKGKLIVKRGKENTVSLKIEGLGKIETGMPGMTMPDFTIEGVKVAAGENGAYTLSLDKFESTAGKISIHGGKLTGTVRPDGNITIDTSFKPGAMPMPISLSFSGSKKAQKK